MAREHTNAHRTLHAIFSLSTLCCEAKHTKAQTVKFIWRSFYSFESSYLYTAMDNDDGDVYCNEMYWGQQNLILVGCLLVLLQIFCYTIGTRFNFHFSLLWIFLLYFLSFLFISIYLLTYASVLLSTFYAIQNMYEPIQWHSCNTLNYATIIITTHLTR